MKKVIVLILALFLVFSFSGCIRYNEREIDNSDRDHTITYLYNDGWTIILRDNETGIQYICYNGHGLCVRVDADGMPLIEENGK